MSNLLDKILMTPGISHNPITLRRLEIVARKAEAARNKRLDSLKVQIGDVEGAKFCVYRVRVDYDLSINQLLDKYGCREKLRQYKKNEQKFLRDNPGERRKYAAFWGKNFDPINIIRQIRTKKRGQATIKIVIWRMHCAKPVKTTDGAEIYFSKDVLQELKRHNYRPAEFHETLPLTKKFTLTGFLWKKGLFENHDIAALGSTVRLYGHEYCPLTETSFKDGRKDWDPRPGIRVGLRSNKSGWDTWQKFLFPAVEEKISSSFYRKYIP